jgi:hypothetical protein
LEFSYYLIGIRAESNQLPAINRNQEPAGILLRNHLLKVGLQVCHGHAFWRCPEDSAVFRTGLSPSDQSP